MSEALYRKYRPQIFEDVVGQEHIERTLKNAIEQDKVSHAYLFCGPRGTGKTTTARLLAKALLCQKGPTAHPDGTCDDCKMIAEGVHPDVYELDAASRTGVDNVREEIIGRVQFAPTRGRYKIYIIDEVHMLSTAAFNALLKTLEEPPDHVVFILATTDPQKVPETIHSRCQRFDFRRIAPEAMVSRLGAICVAEGVDFEGEALDLIAHRAEGGLRNALTSLEQMIAFGEGKVTMEVAERMLGSLDSSDLAAIVQAVGSRDVAACFRWTAEYVETGADLAQFVRDFAEHMRNMYVLALAGDDVALDVSESARRELASELPLFGCDRLARMLCVLGDVSNDLKTSTNPRLTFEIALTRMCRPDSDLTLESLAERVEALESGYSAVAHVCGAGGRASAGVGAVAADAAAGVVTGGALGVAGSGAAAADVAAGAGAAAGVGARSASAGAGASAGFNAAGAADGSHARELAGLHADGLPANSGGRAAVASAIDAAGQTLEGFRTSGAFKAPVDASTDAFSASASAAVAPENAVGGGAPSAALLSSLQNPAALQRVWQAALTALKKSKAAYGVLFMNTKAVFDSARSLLVAEFPAENTFAFRAVQKPEIQDALAAALVQACGEPLAFAYSQAGGSEFMAGGSSVARVSQGQAPADRPSAGQAQVRQAHNRAVGSADLPAQEPAQWPVGNPGQNHAQSLSQSAANGFSSPAASPAKNPEPAKGTEVRAGEAAREPVSPPAPSGFTSQIAPPEPDYAPVDVYDDVVPYDDEPNVYDSGFAFENGEGQMRRARPSAEAQPIQQSVQMGQGAQPVRNACPSAEANPVQSFSETQLAQPGQNEQAARTEQSAQPAQPASGQGDLGEEGLEELLSASFGGNVVVREVQ